MPLHGGVRGRAWKWGLIAATVALALVWYAQAEEAEPWTTAPATEHSRFFTLRNILDNSNNGYQFQVSPGVGMETEWEDPGNAFFTVLLGLRQAGRRVGGP